MTDITSPKPWERRPDGPQHIARLIGKVINVSPETVGIVEGLPELGVGEV